MTYPQTQRRRAFLRTAAGLSTALLLGERAVLAAPDASGAIVLGQSFDASQSELALISRVQRAYFDSVNAAGGVHGRRIQLVSLDDRGDIGVRQRHAAELLENHRAQALFGMPSLPPGQTVLPQLFVRDRAAARASATPDGVLVSFYPGHALEGRLLARHLMAHGKAPRTAILHGDDAQSRELLSGLRAGLGKHAGAVLGKIISASADGNALSSAIQGLRASGDGALVVLAPPATTLQALSLARDTGWNPQSFIASESASALESAPEVQAAKAVGAQSLRYLIDANDPTWAKRKPFHFAEFSRWDNDRGVQAYTVFLKKHARDVDPKSEVAVWAYSTAQLMVYVLSQCQGQHTTKDITRQALRLGGYNPPLINPGIRVYSHPARAAAITQAQPIRFDGRHWTETGGVLEADDD